MEKRSPKFSTTLPPPPDPIYVKVYFLDNSYKTFRIDAADKTPAFESMIASKLGFENPSEDGYWFGLWESKNGATLDRPLTKMDCPGKIAKEWAPNSPSKFVYVIKLFLDTLIKSTDTKIQELRYIQAVHSIITNQYPVDEETALKLAALQFKATFPTEEYVSDFLGPKIVEFIPSRHLAKKRGDMWEEDLREYLAANAEVAALGEKEARTMYLEVVEQLKCYGCTFFPCSQFITSSEPENVRAGVSSKGLLLFGLESLEPFHTYELGDLLRWGYVPTSTFYVSVSFRLDVGKTCHFLHTLWRRKALPIITSSISKSLGFIVILPYSIYMFVCFLRCVLQCTWSNPLGALTFSLLLNPKP